VSSGNRRWDELGDQPSWYLDPLVAEQKRLAYQRLVRNWAQGLEAGTILKTDLFEEAHGDDQILFDLLPGTRQVLGIDVAQTTVRRAKARCRSPEAVFVVTDVRSLGLASNSVDLIVSNSTLDHFDTRQEFESSVKELARVLGQGGVLVLTLDNPRNPFYRVLRWSSRRGWTPFVLGYTVSGHRLNRCLQDAGLEVTDSATLLHNPRIISTLVFLGLRRLFGRHADWPVRFLLFLFSLMERLPTRGLTACFLAIRARKPEAAKDETPAARLD